MKTTDKSEGVSHELKNDVLQTELSKLVSRDGAIHPEDVVKAAQKASHPLHGYFEWDDTKAGYAYRLKQAQELIRYVKITVETPEHRTVIVRMFESLPSDRKEGDGYRTIQSIMSNQERKRELLSSALKELESFRQRYQHLCELAGVMKEINKIRRKAERVAVSA